jgi:hypothetical protein
VNRPASLTRSQTVHRSACWGWFLIWRLYGRVFRGCRKGCVEGKRTRLSFFYHLLTLVQLLQIFFADSRFRKYADNDFAIWTESYVILHKGLSDADEGTVVMVAIMDRSLLRMCAASSSRDPLHTFLATSWIGMMIFLPELSRGFEST